MTDDNRQTVPDATRLQEHKCDNHETDTNTLRELFNGSSKTDNVLQNTEQQQCSETTTVGRNINAPTYDMPSPPKPGQKYWLSAEAKKRKNEYMREYYIRKKESLLQLQEHQLKPRYLKLLMVNDQVVSTHLESDGDYVKVIDELLGTLLDNKILKDYALA